MAKRRAKTRIKFSPPGAQFFADDIRHVEQSYTPTVEPDASPGKCYHIASQYIPFLITGLDYFTSDDNFQGDDATRQLAAARITTLQAILMTGNLACNGEPGMEFRQNPSDACQLQYSTDGGGTWKLMFDYSLCAGKTNGKQAPSAQAIAAVSVEINNWVGDYDGNTNSVAPELIHDNSPTDDYRDQAVCALIYQILLDIQAIAKNTDAQCSGWHWDIYRWLNKATIDALTAVLWLDSAGVIPLTVEERFGIILCQSLERQIYDDVREWDITPLREDALIQSLICYAFNEVRGDSISYSQWSSMFDGADSLDNMNTDCLEFIQTVFQDEDGYAAFIGATNDLVAELESGNVVYDCPCQEFEHVFDFTADDGGFIIKDGGVWTAGQGWLSTTVSGKQLLSIYLEFNQRVLYSIEIDYYAAAASNGGVRRITRYPDNTHVALSTGTGTFNTEDTSQSDVNKIGLWLDTNNVASANKITTLTVRGYGQNPFTL